MKLLTNILILQLIFSTAATADDTLSAPTTNARSSWSIDSIVNACHSRVGSYESSDNNKNIDDAITTTAIRHRICDLTISDGIIDSQDIEKLEHMILHLEDKHFVSCNDDTAGTTENNARDTDDEDNDANTNAVNIQMAIVIVPKMSTEDVPWHYSTDQNVERFATTIHNELGVGHCCDDKSIENTGTSSGIVLFISVEDRAMYVSTSEGVQSILTSTRLNTILNHNMKPYLKQGDYHAAVSTFVNSVEEYFVSGPPSVWEQYLMLVTMLVVVSCGFVNQYRESQKKRNYAEVHSKLNKLDQDRALLLMGQYRCTSCPICLEDFQLGSVKYINENNNDNSHPVDNTGTTKENDDDNNDDVHRHNINDDVIGSDGLPVRILRCGHAFDELCWQEWISKGSKSSSDVTKCPVCRIDLKNDNSSSSSRSNQSSTTTTISMTTNDNNDTDNDDTNYDSSPLSVSSSSFTTSTHINRNLNRWYRTERNFRLTRIRYRYPGYVRPSQLKRWMNTNYNDNLTNDPDFVRNKPATSTDTRSGGGNNSEGSSLSSNCRYGGTFGGGRSSGGGGCRW